MKTFISKILSVTLAASMLFAPVFAAASELPDEYHNDHLHDRHDHEDYEDGYQTCCLGGMSEELPFLTANLEKNCYDINDEFTVIFSAENLGDIVDVEIINNGFTLVGEPNITSATEFSVTLKAAESQIPETSITLTAVCVNGETASESLYSYYAYEKMFISNLDATNAYTKYLVYELDNGIITDAEYEMKFSEYSSQCVTSGVFITTSTQNIGGGYETNYVPTHELKIMGTVTWVDDFGTSFPLQYAKVGLYSLYAGNIILTTYTDEDGEYSFSFDDTVGIYGQNFFVRVYAEGEAVRVVSETEEQSNASDNPTIVRTVYSVNSATATDVDIGETTTINLSINMSQEAGQAMQISQAAILASKYVNEMKGNYFSSIDVIYPHINQEKKDGCFFSWYDWDDDGDLDPSISITNVSAAYGRPQPYASWDVIMHEYGHYVQARLNITQNPGGTHYVNHNLLTHPDFSYTKDVAIRLAWAESYASIFGELAQHYFLTQDIIPRTTCNKEYDSHNGANFKYDEYKDGPLYEASEESICGVLWDIYDSDTLNFGHQKMWNLMSSASTEYGTVIGDLTSFLKYFCEKYPDEYIELSETLSYYRIAPHDLSIDNFDGTTAPTFTWGPGGTANYNNDDKNYLNNSFYIVLCEENMTPIDIYFNIEYTVDADTNEISYSGVPLSTWKSVLINNPNGFYVVISARQVPEGNEPTTGDYLAVFYVENIHTHAYAYTPVDNDVHTGICPCGKTLSSIHSWSNGTCTLCGRVHSHSYSYTYNNTTHTGTCACGVITSGNHTFVNYVCSVCNKTHTHMYKYTSNNAVSHTGTCACGATVTSNHVWVGEKCKNCGRAKPPNIVMSLPPQNGDIEKENEYVLHTH